MLLTCGAKETRTPDPLLAKRGRLPVMCSSLIGMSRDGCYRKQLQRTEGYRPCHQLRDMRLDPRRFGDIYRPPVACAHLPGQND